MPEPITPDQLLEEAVQRVITAREEWRVATIKVGIVFAEREARRKLGVLRFLLDDEKETK